MWVIVSGLHTQNTFFHINYAAFFSFKTSLCVFILHESVKLRETFLWRRKKLKISLGAIYEAVGTVINPLPGCVVDHKRSRDNQVCGDKTVNGSKYICAVTRWAGVIGHPEV